MSRIIDLPPENASRNDGVLGGWWRDDSEGRILCELCPRACRLKPGDRGFCFVRQNVDNEMLLTTYGKSTGFCIDPIEKKPLNHFYPGSSVLSFGTAGCNLGCRFCQNWDISKSREVERLSERATPEMIAAAAQEHGCQSVAFTYNDPVIWAEYAIDTAQACRQLGVKTVAVTAGYITPQARAPFFHAMDAANVDLKAFSEEFYYELTASHLEPVLETLEWLQKESDVWFEITNLIIPQANDGHDELREMCDWVLDRLGDEVPVHFTAFHPDFRMKDRPRTPHETLLEAKQIALEQGLKFAYVGNVDDVKHQSTYCPNCRELLIERNWYELGRYALDGNQCRKCGQKIAGRFAEKPGTWGRKRLPLRISQFEQSPAQSTPNQSTPKQPTPRISPVKDNPTQVVQLSEPKPTPPPTTLKSEPSMSTSTSLPNVPVQPDLTTGQESVIHAAACEIVASCVNSRATQLADPMLDGAADKLVMGAFVTLKRQGQLRACCGNLGAPMQLSRAVAEAAKRTALEDHRLPTISPLELEHLDLDVTLLYAFEPIEAEGDARSSEVEVGTHGLQVRQGNKAGLLLPVVASEQNYSAEEFLRQACRKAGLPGSAWLDSSTEILRFQGHSIKGEMQSETLSPADRESPQRFSRQDAEALADHCRVTIMALVEGRTPNYYVAGAADGDVLGVTLTVRVEGLETPIQVGSLSMRKSVPLQASLNQFCQQAARGLQMRNVANANRTVDVAILTDSAMQGTVTSPDLRGFDPATRAMVVSISNKMKWRFDSNANSDELLQRITTDLNCADSADASIYSLQCASSSKASEFSNVPEPFLGPEERSPAVAGMFYPQSGDELQKMVGEMIDREAGKSPQAAVMLPHAGLVYSGKVAGETLSQAEIPQTVIVIGPKHTRNGVDWAVAPHKKWMMPGAPVESDPALAQQLAEVIPGLELDSAAHANEHAIEVELPFIQALAPEAKVVGIVLGSGTLEQAKAFASGLADVIRTMDEAPLLVVSSDMNHYASDEDNRRLDAMALDALETCDSEKLFTTCRDNDISMCGLLPAIVVMETLKELGQLNAIKRTSYTTSAEASGDSSRVVGYAGALFD